MDLIEYSALDALGLAELVRQRQVSQAEVAASALQAAEALNPSLRAVIETHDDRGEASGDEAAAGMFAGVPLMLKDIGCTEAGRLCEAGSRLMRSWRAPRDTGLMRRFRAAGLVNLGRTTTSEFACTATVETAATGTTHNPWHRSFTTGGSSGGSAAVVASGIVPVAHGSDGGGSIRIPASCCGVVGLKPSRGRTSPSPARAFPGDLSVEFALTRTVRDAAALLDSVGGPVRGDPHLIDRGGTSYVAALHDRTKLKIAFTTEHFWGGSTDPEVAAAVAGIAACCEELGHSVQNAHPRFDWEPYVEATLDVWCAMTAASVAWAVSETGRSVTRATLEGHTRSWNERGRALSALELAAAVQILGAVSLQIGQFFDEYDVLLSPTIPTLPPELGQYDPDENVPATWYYQSPIGDLESTTSLFNCTGQPAMSLPLCQSASGLPIGVHLAARFGDERTLLSLAASLEEALPWAARVPPHHAGSSYKRLETADENAGHTTSVA